MKLPTLANLLIFFGAVGVGILCSLSLNFLSLGGTVPVHLHFFSLSNTVPSIIWGMLFALILGGLAFGAKLLKKASDKFEACMMGERILLFLFVVLALTLIPPFSHFFAVTEQRAAIQSKMLANIEQAEGMFDKYEEYANNRLQMYENRLRSVAAARQVNPRVFRDFGFVAGTDVNTQISNKVFTLRAMLYPSNYEAMKQESTNELARARNSVTYWWPISIVNIVNSLESEITSQRDELIGFSSFRAQNEEADCFEYPLAFDFEEVADKMTTLGRPTWIAVLIAIVLYALMLPPWISEERSSKSPYNSFLSIFTGAKKKRKSKFSIDSKNIK